MMNWLRPLALVSARAAASALVPAAHAAHWPVESGLAPVFAPEHYKHHIKGNP